MQNYEGLVWLLIPFVFIVIIAFLMIVPRSGSVNQKRAFYVVIVVGLIFLGAYYIIRTFIIP